MAMAEVLSYRSPVSKLLPFFHLSRDQWKAKCVAAKLKNRRLKTRLGQVMESRDRWKAEARALRKRCQAEAASAAEGTKNPR